MQAMDYLHWKPGRYAIVAPSSTVRMPRSRKALEPNPARPRLLNDGRETYFFWPLILPG